jgi:hypothetical protein
LASVALMKNSAENCAGNCSTVLSARELIDRSSLLRIELFQENQMHRTEAEWLSGPKWGPSTVNMSVSLSGALKSRTNKIPHTRKLQKVGISHPIGARKLDRPSQGSNSEHIIKVPSHCLFSRIDATGIPLRSCPTARLNWSNVPPGK